VHHQTIAVAMGTLESGGKERKGAAHPFEPAPVCQRAGSDVDNVVHGQLATGAKGVRS